MAYASYMHADYVRSEVADAFGAAAKDYMLAVSLVGGFLALFRSSATHALAQEIRERMQGTQDLFATAMAARSDRTVDASLNRCRNMIELAIELPDLQPGIFAMSLWYRDDGSSTWRIIASKGVTPETEANFAQPILTVPVERAGVVANLAVADDDTVIIDDVSRSSWFADDPDSTGQAIGLACVLLRDRNLHPIAALCITSNEKGVVPAPSDSERHKELEDVLLLWRAAFTFPVEHLARFQDEK